MSSIVWTQEKGWHDGAECAVGLDGRGRLVIGELPKCSNPLHGRWTAEGVVCLCQRDEHHRGGSF